MNVVCFLWVTGFEPIIILIIKVSIVFSMIKND